MWMTCLFLALGQAEPESTEAALLELMRRNRAQVETVTAQFQQFDETPEGDYHSRGRVWFGTPRKLLVEYEDPALVYLIEGTRVYEYDAELEQLTIYNVDDQPGTEALFLGFQSDTSRLEEAYDIAPGGPGGVPGAAMSIILRPDVDDPAQALFDRLTIFLREGDWLPVRIDIDVDDETDVLMNLSDVRINPDLDEDAFTVAIPEGTTVIENDQFREVVPEGGISIPVRYAPPPAPAVSESELPAP